MALDVVEQHSRAVHSGGPHDSSSGSHMAVYATELRRRVHLHVGFDDLAWDPPQDHQRVPEGKNIGTVVHKNHHVGAVPAQIGTKTEAAKLTVFLYKEMVKANDARDGRPIAQEWVILMLGNCSKITCTFPLV